MLRRFGMSDCHPVHAPVESSSRSDITGTSLDLPVNVPYRHVVGSIMYLFIGTRPDLAFTIRKLSQHLENPLQSHWVAAKRVLRYIAGACEHSILFQGANETKLIGYTDSDWAGCVKV